MNEALRHADGEELARLAELGHEQADPELLAHLAVCAPCMAQYGEVVRSLDAELVSSDGVLASVAQATPVRRSPAPRRGRRLAWAAGSVAVAAVLLFFLLPLGPGTLAPNDPRSIVTARLVELSIEGLVYPGVSELSDESSVRYRSGGSPSALEVEAVDGWSSSFTSDPQDAQAAYWLAASHLADGKLQAADDVLRRALEKNPDRSELLHLEAIVAYRRNEVDRAQISLQRILRSNPDDSWARFNLATIQSETGEHESARAVFEELAAEDGSELLQVRARAWIDQEPD